MRKIVTVLFLSLIGVGVLAQTRTVKGFVLEEETGQPLPAATVSVEGSTRGVIAGLDGAYEIGGIRATDKLKFEFSGKETQVVEVGTQTSITVRLKDQANELDEVTIVAFGKQKKESVIGSITTVDVSTLKVPSSNFTTSLAGNVAGIIAYQRSGEPGQDNADFFVRGITTFGANTNPLILIDNIELTTISGTILSIRSVVSLKFRVDS